MYSLLYITVYTPYCIRELVTMGWSWVRRHASHGRALLGSSGVYDVILW